MHQFSTSALFWLTSILDERFGHAFTLAQEAEALVLTLQSSEGSIRFDRLQAVFHQSRSVFPCHQWDAPAEGYTAPIDDWLPAPSETGLPSPLIEISDNGAVIHYDILGLAYWMLTRLEEVGRSDLDDHQRFPAISSHAFKHDYLERPIVDEWLHILGQVIQRQWPGLTLKQHQFSMKVSHDVDGPSRYGFCSAKSLVRGMAGDVLKRGDFKSAALAPWIRINSRHRLHPADPANTFDWIMDQSEKHGLTSAFYFICGRTDPSRDADYEPEHPAIRELMRRIHQRGHEIGLHPSYNTYQNPQAIVTEANRLRKAMSEEGIKQQDFGGRMHYLRWEHPTTMLGWELAGMTYDSTLSYADRPGFRCGTCFEYPAFDPAEGETLRLRIRPLIAMECTVMAERYLGLGAGEVAFEKFELLKQRCRAVQGCFTLLWHNSQFNDKPERALYQRIFG
ncbi:polysaccharide deacetylase family protein [Pseudomonas sp. OIL-1]|uniref:polysaccharide deacetylase family protein n=1 Tax=Pseudomonas sp. OIL-1 TaxID=2706126 RepID=UPI0013A7A024|nr:polysaccharide deacetylase family protein [Pseudomonas sp. OIL-1]QIB52611.1 hypothetical protein G3M63_17110 [Pseudomonas sp. OIL-1]